MLPSSSALGGVGGFDVQLAAAIDPQRLDALENYGAAFTLRADDLDPKDLKKQVRAFADERGVPSWRQKIFETSGTTAGQSTAFRLLGPLQHLSILPRAARRPWDTQSPCTS